MQLTGYRIVKLAAGGEPGDSIKISVPFSLHWPLVSIMHGYDFDESGDPRGWICHGSVLNDLWCAVEKNEDDGYEVGVQNVAAWHITVLIQVYQIMDF